MAVGAERDLLFGIVALQLDFVTREQLIAAASAWVKDKSRQLGEILVEQGAIDPSTCTLLNTLVARHMTASGSDPERSIAAFPAAASVQEDFSRLGDKEIEATIDHLFREPAEKDRNTIDFQGAPPIRPASAGRPVASGLAGGKANSVPLPGGRFRVLHGHARGGLSQISIALDEELRRKVAFKQLLERHSADPQCRSRLLLEGEITGSLEHPGIVPVYGMGLYPDGRPFYAMRFIRGESLREAIKRVHQAQTAASDPTEVNLEFRRLLTHFVAISNTMNYAHSRGVLHRDLKPDNVMLGKYGEVLVVDWGLAKAIGWKEGEMPAGADPHEQPLPAMGASTEMGKVMGTPAYMSPEQAEGRPDELGPASDIYSLGATLYCLLTNQPPFRGDDIRVLLDNLRQAKFPRPRELDRHVPRGLEAVCLKAMALRPADRYATARALAEDIEHWLADEPVVAYRDTVVERLFRWARRHRSWTRAGAVALILVAVVSVVASALVNRARQQAINFAERNRVLAEKEERARHEATDRLVEAQNAVDTWLTGMSEALAYYPGVQEARKELLRRAAADYERFVRQRSDDPALETERGRAYLRLGDVHRTLREVKEADKAYRSAISLLEKLSQTSAANDAGRLELANGQTKLGLLLAETGRHAEARAAYDASMTQLAGTMKGAAQQRRQLELKATCLLNSGVLQMTTGARREAEETLQKARREFEGLLRTDPDERRYQASMATAQTVLARLFVEDGKLDEARGEMSNALAVLDAIVAQSPGDPRFLDSRAASRLYFAGIARRYGRSDEELAAYRQAAEDYRTLANALPDVPLCQENLALTQVDLAQLLRELGALGQAEAELRRAEPMLLSLADKHPEIPRYQEEESACQDLLGLVLLDLGRASEAKTISARARAGYERLAKAYPNVPEYRERRAICESHLGQILHGLEQRPAAEEALRAATAELERLIQGAGDQSSYKHAAAFAYLSLGNLLREMNRPSEARKSFDRALQLWRQSVAEVPSPEFQCSLAWALVQCEDPQLRDPKAALELAQGASDAAPRNPEYRSAAGAALYRSGQWLEACRALKEAIQARSTEHCRDWLYLAMAQCRLQSMTDAATSLKRGRELFMKNHPGNRTFKQLEAEAVALFKPGAKPSDGK